MKQETLEEAAIIYAHKSFVWPLNKQGEKQSIPPGQIVPPGYTKHQKIATKHFIAGYKLAQERSYSEEELLAFGKSCFYKGFEKAEKDDANCYTAFREEIGSLFEQFKNK